MICDQCHEKPNENAYWALYLEGEIFPEARKEPRIFCSIKCIYDWAYKQGKHYFPERLGESDQSFIGEGV